MKTYYLGKAFLLYKYLVFLVEGLLFLKLYQFVLQIVFFFFILITGKLLDVFY